MLDLIHVIIVAVALDMLDLVPAWLNTYSLSQPVQAFSYILKFCVKFVVAARGL